MKQEYAAILSRFSGKFKIVYKMNKNEYIVDNLCLIIYNGKEAIIVLFEC